MILELHLLQSFPVSNLNRDDVGQPKTATFGGCTRGRLSSQSIKRSARLLLDHYGLGTDETGVRTKRLLEKATQHLATRDRDAETASAVVRAGLTDLGFGVTPNGLTQYLLYVGRPAIGLLADYCERNWERLVKTASMPPTASTTRGKPASTRSNTKADKPKKERPTAETIAEAKRILNASQVTDIALFGRMIADNKDFNVDAASQVAHAISTHPVVNEYDYYTAIDDFKPEDQAGADMIGTVDFNAACYYRYANLNLQQLDENLQGDQDLADRATRAWLYAFVHAVPSGKQNSMAALTKPDTLLGVVREHGSWNLANAFLKPVTGTDLMTDSTTRLLGHFGRLRRFYGDSTLRTVAGASLNGELKDIDPAETTPSLDAFADRLLTTMRS